MLHKEVQQEGRRVSVLPQGGGREALAELSRFRTAFYGCLSARADAFFELTDALLCADGPTRTPVELSLLAEHQRGYGSLYGALNHGRFDASALRDLLVSLPLPWFDRRIVLTVKPGEQRPELSLERLHLCCSEGAL
ncbi:transposase [Streptomyces sp. NPDC102340]|uniref:transposase n=1 Tax=unclassified Streptomyces TaxID=2593676 RepID=UPI00380A8808